MAGKMIVPKRLKDSEINLDALEKICQDYIDFVDSEEFYEDNDYDSYISETALQVFFGKDIFDFINARNE